MSEIFVHMPARPTDVPRLVIRRFPRRPSDPARQVERPWTMKVVTDEFVLVYRTCRTYREALVVGLAILDHVSGPAELSRGEA